MRSPGASVNESALTSRHPPHSLEYRSNSDLIHSRAAPIPRPLVVFGNLAVAFAITGLQVVALVVAAVLRGAHFHTNPAEAMQISKPS